jgi:sarcosine oxidase
VDEKASVALDVGLRHRVPLSSLGPRLLSAAVQGSYDVIVLGLGAMGSAALHQLAARGLRVLGLERFTIPHDRGSYHGRTRIIRMAYHEHPSYVVLLRRAYPLWRELEQESGERLLHVTGSLDAGAVGGSFVDGSLASCREHGLAHELLSATEIASRFPAFHLPDDFAGVLQPEGGYLLAERAVVAFVEGARRRGAEVRTETSVREWRVDGESIEVRTESGVDRATALVIAAGAWAAKLVPAIADLARPERQVVGWFRPRRPELFEAERFPVFDILFEEGNYYGLPASGQPGFKLGRHGHLHEAADPDQVDRAIHPRDEAVLRRALARYLPDGDGDAVALTTCLFTNSPDQHFIVDRIHDLPPVVIAAGFSGHGFKFAPVIGEILADLATTGSSRHPIDRFRLARFDAPATAR